MHDLVAIPRQFSTAGEQSLKSLLELGNIAATFRGVRGNSSRTTSDELLKAAPDQSLTPFQPAPAGSSAKLVSETSADSSI
jgi:hypothetical protein